jgi:hypothetical protein
MSLFLFGYKGRSSDIRLPYQTGLPEGQTRLCLSTGEDFSRDLIRVVLGEHSHITELPQK